MRPEKLGGACENIASETTQAALHYLERPRDAWYSEIVENIKEYLYQIKEYIPREYRKLWTSMA